MNKIILLFTLLLTSLLNLTEQPIKKYEYTNNNLDLNYTINNSSNYAIGQSNGFDVSGLRPEFEHLYNGETGLFEVHKRNDLGDLLYLDSNNELTTEVTEEPYINRFHRILAYGSGSNKYYRGYVSLSIDNDGKGQTFKVDMHPECSLMACNSIVKKNRYKHLLYFDFSFYDPNDSIDGPLDDRNIKYLQSLSFDYGFKYTTREGFAGRIKKSHDTHLTYSHVERDADYEEDLDNKKETDYWTKHNTFKQFLDPFHNGKLKLDIDEVQGSYFRLDKNSFRVFLPDNLESYENQLGLDNGMLGFGNDTIDLVYGSIGEVEYILSDEEVDEVNIDLQEQYDDMYRDIFFNEELDSTEKILALEKLNFDFRNSEITYNQVLKSECGVEVIDECEFEIDTPDEGMFDSIDDFFSKMLNVILLFCVVILLVVTASVWLPLFITFFTSLILPLIKSIYTVLKNILNWFFNWLSSGLLPVLKQNIPIIVDAIKEFLKTLYKGFKKYFVKFWELLEKHLPKLYEKFISVLKAIFDFILNMFKKVINFFKGLKKNV